MSSILGISLDQLASQLDNPRMMEWLLLQHQRQMIEEPLLRELFSTERLAALIQSAPTELVVDTLIHLPAALFAGLEEDLYEFALRAGEGAPAAVPPVLIANDVDKGVELLGRLLDAFGERDEEDLDLYDFAEGVVAALEDLAPERGLDLVDELLEESDLLDPIQRARLAIAFDTNVADFLIDAFDTEWPPEVAWGDLTEQPTYQLADALLGRSDIITFVSNLAPENPDGLVLMPQLFRDGAPLETLDTLIADPDADGPDADGLFDLLRNTPETPAVTTLIAVLDELDTDAIEPDPLTGLTLLVAAAIVEAWLLPAPEDASLAALLDGALTTLSPTDWKKALFDRLLEGDSQEIADALTARLQSEDPGDPLALEEIAQAAAPNAIVPAILAWSQGAPRTTPLEPGQDALDALIGAWRSLDPNQRFFALPLLRRLAPERLANFLVDHFEDHRPDILQLEVWCDLAITAPDARLLPLLASELRRSSNTIPHTFALIATIVQPDHPRLPEVQRRLEEIEQRLDDSRPSIELILKCQDCHRTDLYTLHRLEVEVSEDDWVPHLPTTLACTSCNTTRRLALTEFAAFEIEAELLNAVALEGTDHADESPIVLKAAAPPRVEQVVRAQPKISRNAPCPCGSGKKYKKCCGA